MIAASGGPPTVSLMTNQHPLDESEPIAASTATYEALDGSGDASTRLYRSLGLADLLEAALNATDEQFEDVLAASPTTVVFEPVPEKRDDAVAG